MKPNFVRVPSAYGTVPRAIGRIVPEFLASREFGVLDSADRETPGLVCAAFAKYVARKHRELPPGRLSSRSGENELARCYLAIESLAASEELAIKNLVVVEIFENVQCEGETFVSHMIERLGPASRALYELWMR